MRSKFVSAAMFAFSAIAAPIASAGTFSFNTLPADGMVSGLSSAPVGWGYSITNQSATEWLVPSALQADSFSFGSPDSLFDFPILAPGMTVSTAYDALNGVGLYQFFWDADAPDGFTNFGRFTLSAEWWNGDPFNGGSFIQDASDSTQPYFATVSTAVSNTPEPPSTIPLVIIFLATGIIRFKEFGRAAQSG